MSYSINVKPIKSKTNKNLFTLNLIFYKDGYNRVPKSLGIKVTDSDIPFWSDDSNQFKAGTSLAKKHNHAIELELSRYSGVAKAWEEEGKNWSPKELSHHFEVGTKTEEKKILTVEEIINERVEYFRNRKRYINGEAKSSKSNSENYVYLKNALREFTIDKYKRNFSFYHIKDITEKFVVDFAEYTKQKSEKNKNQGGLRHKLKLLRAICRYAKNNDPELKYSDKIFEPVEELMVIPETEPSTIPWEWVQKIRNLDRSKFTKEQNIDIDLFLFTAYVGGMSNIDVCYLKYSWIKEDQIIYQRQKTGKRAYPIIPEFGKALMNKYVEESFDEYVFPVILARHISEEQKEKRIEYISLRVNKTLEKVRKMIRYREPIRWYSGRGSYITQMLDHGEHVTAVAKQAGNSSAMIDRHYYRLTNKGRLLHKVNKIFAE